jgi:hypothetical protein
MQYQFVVSDRERPIESVDGVEMWLMDSVAQAGGVAVQVHLMTVDWTSCRRLHHLAAAKRLKQAGKSEMRTHACHLLLSRVSSL